MFIQIIFGFNMKEWLLQLLMAKSLYLRISSKSKLSTMLLEQKIFTTLHALRNSQKDFSWQVIKDTWRCGFDVKKTIKAQTKRINYLTLFDVGEFQILNSLQLSQWTLTQVKNTFQLLVETITSILFMLNRLDWTNQWIKKSKLINLLKDSIRGPSQLLTLLFKDL